MSRVEYPDGTIFITKDNFVDLGDVPINADGDYVLSEADLNQTPEVQIIPSQDFFKFLMSDKSVRKFFDKYRDLK